MKLGIAIFSFFTFSLGGLGNAQENGTPTHISWIVQIITVGGSKSFASHLLLFSRIEKKIRPTSAVPSKGARRSWSVTVPARATSASPWKLRRRH